MLGACWSHCGGPGQTGPPRRAGRRLAAPLGPVSPSIFLRSADAAGFVSPSVRPLDRGGKKKRAEKEHQGQWEAEQEPEPRAAEPGTGLPAGRVPWFRRSTWLGCLWETLGDPGKLCGPWLSAHLEFTWCFARMVLIHSFRRVLEGTSGSKAGQTAVAGVPAERPWSSQAEGPDPRCGRGASAFLILACAPGSLRPRGPGPHPHCPALVSAGQSQRGVLGVPAGFPQAQAPGGAAPPCAPTLCTSSGHSGLLLGGTAPCVAVPPGSTPSPSQPQRGPRACDPPAWTPVRPPGSPRPSHQPRFTSALGHLSPSPIRRARTGIYRRVQAAVRAQMAVFPERPLPPAPPSSTRRALLFRSLADANIVPGLCAHARRPAGRGKARLCGWGLRL